MSNRKSKAPERYDVAMSFAGEDRSYVEMVVRILKARQLTVFYDEDEKAALWGKDLFQELSNVYATRSTLVIVFVSKHYLRKKWPKHELRAAQSEALSRNGQFMLPARFDDTELPGLHSTLGQIDLRLHSPTEVADLICRTLKFPKLESAKTLQVYSENGVSGSRFSEASKSAQSIRLRATSLRQFLFQAKDALVEVLSNEMAVIRVMIAEPSAQMVVVAEKMESPEGHRKGQIAKEIRTVEKVLLEIKAESVRRSPKTGRLLLAKESGSYRVPMLLCDERWGWMTFCLPPKRAVDCPSMEMFAGSKLLELSVKHFDAAWQHAFQAGKVWEVKKLNGNRKE
jgi:hypothetical protein